MSWVNNIGWAILLGLMMGCMPKDIDLNLPEYENQLVVEGYLEAGSLPSVHITESISFFDEPKLPIVRDAVVTLTHSGNTDTLRYDGIFSYLGTDTILRDAEPYELRVETPDGRVATSSTQFLPIIPLDSINYNRDSADKARMLLYWQDPGGIQNYYRITSVQGNGNKPFSIEINDDLFDGRPATWVTSAKYKINKTVFVRLYHVEPAYYRFLTSVWNAGLSQSGPISEPTSIVSNIEGGLGIFTSLNYSELSVKIQ